MPLAPPLSDDPNSFWQVYRKSYQGSLADAEKGNLSALDEIFFNLKLQTSNLKPSLSSAASRVAIMLYRGYPLLQQPSITELFIGNR
jgi:hypothetical protein